MANILKLIYSYFYGQILNISEKDALRNGKILIEAYELSTRFSIFRVFWAKYNAVHIRITMTRIIK